MDRSGSGPGAGEDGAHESLFLLFRLGDDSYALDVRRIVEVLPLVQLKRIPKAPIGIAGVIDYRGVPVPVVDLCELTLGRTATARLSSRLVLVHYGAEAPGERRILGLLVERATGALRRDPASFVPAGVASKAAPFLGSVSPGGDGLIQLIQVDNLLPAAVKDALFTAIADF